MGAVTHLQIKETQSLQGKKRVKSYGEDFSSSPVPEKEIMKIEHRPSLVFPWAEKCQSFYKSLLIQLFNNSDGDILLLTFAYAAGHCRWHDVYGPLPTLHSIPDISRVISSVHEKNASAPLTFWAARLLVGSSPLYYSIDHIWLQQRWWQEQFSPVRSWRYLWGWPPRPPPELELFSNENHWHREKQFP